jgi:hypothetical protein
MRSRAFAIALLFLTLCAIYLPDIGHGFITDDFRWIYVGRVSSIRDLPRLLAADVGFYRPLVMATFSVDYALFGLNAFPFALTNFAFLIAAAFLIVRLARALGLSALAAVTAAAVWCFNFHGVNAALLWISGRTALLLCLFALLAATALLRRRPFAAGVWCLLALLSKEEAVTLPFFLTGWAWVTADAPDRRWRSLVSNWPLFGALAIYLALRLHSGAFWPGDAPSYYRFVFAPATVLKNIGEYLDRSATVPAAVALVVWIVVRMKPSLAAADTRVLWFGGLWLVTGFALTLFLPVRSDLYALTPSVGSALACGVLVQAWHRRAATRVNRTLAALVVLPILLMPVYRSRNASGVAPADLSTRLLENPDAIRTADPRDVERAFGSMQDLAIALVMGK